jgi:hypothetical protein
MKETHGTNGDEPNRTARSLHRVALQGFGETARRRQRGDRPGSPIIPLIGEAQDQTDRQRHRQKRVSRPDWKACRPGASTPVCKEGGR